MTELYLKVLISLVFIIGIMLVFFFILKKKISFTNKKNILEILEYRSFGPKTGVIALKMANKIFLLGITATNINLLHQFDAENNLKEEEDKEQQLFEKIKKLKDSLNELE